MRAECRQWRHLRCNRRTNVSRSEASGSLGRKAREHRIDRFANRRFGDSDKTSDRNVESSLLESGRVLTTAQVGLSLSPQPRNKY
jgi:hypothetical protein